MSLADRWNEGKARLGLISPWAKAGMAAVLAKAAEKTYGLWNWDKGLPIDECLESLERHIDAIRRGELYDKDSGLPHIDHAQCNTMFLSHFHHTGRWEGLAKDMHTYQDVKGETEATTSLEDLLGPNPGRNLFDLDDNLNPLFRGRIGDPRFEESEPLYFAMDLAKEKDECVAYSSCMRLTPWKRGEPQYYRRVLSNLQPADGS